jgi:hypothetical protein
MSNLTLGLGLLLLLLGIVSFVGTGATHPTALIPACFGLVMIMLGWMARKENLRKHLMHGAILVALLGFLGSIGGLAHLPALLGGSQVERPGAVVAQSIMALLCAAFIVFAIRSFIQARRSRTGA